MLGPSRTGGFTLVEAVVVLAISSVLLMAAGAMFQAAGNSMDVLAASQRVDWEIKRVLAEACRDAKRASTATLTIDSTDPTADVLHVQVPNADVTTGAIAWGYTDSTGAFRDGWAAEYRVVGTSLVRQVLSAAAVQQGGDLTLCRDVDLTRSGAPPEKGFQATLNGALLDLIVLVRDTTKDGRALTRREETTVHLMNP